MYGCSKSLHVYNVVYTVDLEPPKETPNVRSARRPARDHRRQAARRPGLARPDHLDRRTDRLSRHRVAGSGCEHPTDSQWGMLRLHTVGRQTGKERVAIVGYIEDGANAFVPAMHGWADPEPAWWLNLQAYPEMVTELPDGPRRVTSRAAVGEEQHASGRSFVAPGSSRSTDESAALRSRVTAI